MGGKIELSRLLDGMNVPEDNFDYYRNLELVKLFGADPMLRKKSKKQYVGFLYSIAAYFKEKNLRKPRRLVWYHKQLVDKGVVDANNINATEDFLDSLCLLNFNISYSLCYTFCKHYEFNSGEKSYSMNGRNEFVSPKDDFDLDEDWMFDF